METNQENTGSPRWPMTGLENVQFQFTDAFGNNLPQGALTEAQLQLLSQPGLAFTFFQPSSGIEHQPSTPQLPNQLPTYQVKDENTVQHINEVVQAENKPFIETTSVTESNVVSQEQNQSFNFMPDFSTEYQSLTQQNAQPEGTYMSQESQPVTLDDANNGANQPIINNTMSNGEAQQLLIQDSLDQLQALQEKVANDVHQRGQDVHDMLTVSSTPNIQGSQTQSSVIMNVDGVRQEIPITFCLDNKTYEISNFLDLQNSTNKSQDDNVVEEQIVTSENIQTVSTINEDLRFGTGQVTDVETPARNEVTMPTATSSTCHWDQETTTTTTQIKTSGTGGDTIKIVEAVPLEEGAMDAIHTEPARRSQRLARREEVEAPAPLPPAVFDPNRKPYNTSEMWCETCKHAYPLGCETHALQHVLDKVVLSRAWASLPPLLSIFKLKDEPDADLGVFAKKILTRNMQFGPMIAETVSDEIQLPSTTKFKIPLETKEGVHYIKAIDEDKCNWMMFVRPAENYEEQNLVLHQYGLDIFFTVIKDIPPRAEMKIWYAAHYAHKYGYQLHPVLEANDADTEKKGKFECYECEKSFKTAALLDQHLNEHDSERSGDKSHTVTIKREEKQDGGDYIPAKSRQSVSIVNNTQDPSNKADSGFQSWKKRKRNMYLNKIKKYKEMSKRYEQKRDLRVKGTRSGPSVKDDQSLVTWTPCVPCNIMFDQVKMYTIHKLVHENWSFEQKQDWLETHGFMVLDEQPQPTDTQTVVFKKALCPKCGGKFPNAQAFINHIASHSEGIQDGMIFVNEGKVNKTKQPTVVYRRVRDPKKPFACTLCSMSFPTSNQLAAHSITHTHPNSDRTRMVKCDVCGKQLQNNSALACHMKTHSSEKYYTCPICRTGFDQNQDLKAHCKTHLVNGFLPCAHCHKVFSDLPGIKKHVRMSHTYTELPCPVCGRVFPRPDKLRLHMLSHTDHKDFMCDQCGRQFKRKDKLKDHVKRMHDPNAPKMKGQYVPRAEPRVKFVPKVEPTDFQRFIYKCHQCLLGFKRRGMLVNHLAKRHPNMTPDMVPELNLPILRTQRDYFCQYCDKVYKSSTKRKAHILKVHPGATLPQRQVQANGYLIVRDTASYTQCVGSVTTNPVKCDFCHRQYACKSKMKQHQYKDHPEQMIIRRGRGGRVIVTSRTEVDEKRTDEMVQAKMLEYQQTVTIPQQSTERDLSHTDLLTQAMSEVIDNLDYRSNTQQNSGLTEFQITLPTMGHPIQTVEVGNNTIQPRSSSDAVGNESAQPIVVQQAGGGQATLDLAYLGQALMQNGFTARIINEAVSNRLINENMVDSGTGDQQNAIILQTNDQHQLVIDGSELMLDQVQDHVSVTSQNSLPGVMQDQQQINTTPQSQTVFITDNSLPQAGHSTNLSLAANDGAVREAALGQQTQTITVPLSLASQLLNKTWNQTSQGHVLK